jgi:hypothetical protein
MLFKVLVWKRMMTITLVVDTVTKENEIVVNKDANIRELYTYYQSCTILNFAAQKAILK